jgi:hypothetical protein
MTDEELLIKTIEHWKRIKDGDDDADGETCPLCIRYRERDCEGCMIYENTGLKYCRGTPYEVLRNHEFACHADNIYGLTNQCATCEKIIEQEIEMLESLLRDVIDRMR